MGWRPILDLIWWHIVHVHAQRKPPSVPMTPTLLRQVQGLLWSIPSLEGRGGGPAPRGFKLALGTDVGRISTSLLPRLLPPLVFVWTSSKLLVLEILFVNSVKLNLLVLEQDWCLSPLGRRVPSSEGFEARAGTLELLPGTAAGTA